MIDRDALTNLIAREVEYLRVLAVEDMWVNTSAMMLMLVGEEAMTKPGLERAIRGALDAKNAADNARALIAQEGGE